MADAYGSWAGSYGRWRCHINYGIQSTATSSCVVYCQTRFNTNAWGYNVYGTDTATVNGESASQSSVTHYSATGATVDTTMITKTATISRGTSAKSIAVSGSIQITGGYQNGTSSASGTVSVPALANTTPGTPTSVTATRSSDASIAVKWALTQPSSGSISSNKIEVSIDDGAYTVLSSSLGGSATSYTYTAGTSNHRYRFRVASTNSSGTGAYGYSGYVYTSSPAPTGGYGIQIGSTVSATVLVSNVKYPDYYEWQRSSDGSTWTTLDYATSTIGDTTTISQPYYRVRVVNQGGLATSWTSAFRVSKVPQIWVQSSSIKSIKFNTGTSSSMSGVYYKVA